MIAAVMPIVNEVFHLPKPYYLKKY